MSAAPCVLWFRQDLRLSDNPALAAAAATGSPVIPVYIWAPEEEGNWPPGGAGRWWLHQSLKKLAADLEALGSRLCLRRGPSLAALRELASESGAEAVFWNRRYEPAVLQRDLSIKESLKKGGLRAESFNAALLFEPWEIKTQTEKPYQVFTPFWKSCLKKSGQIPALLPSARFQTLLRKLPSLRLEEFELEPKIDWAQGLREAWRPGEAGARQELERFLEILRDYPKARDFPDRIGTSRLSPHLHFGEISPRQIWHEIQNRAIQDRRGGVQQAAEVFLRELGWREFAHHLLFHFPHTAEEALRPEFQHFPWKSDPTALRAWQRGKTGYPIVDAGMRELWRTGWMHNRVRMIAASFLVKDLLIPWQKGAQWFWDTLVDADLANNTLGWQWVAGCGADAAPYFRVFNPVAQGEKFDAEGNYVRRYLSELTQMPASWIHRPWEAPASILEKARVIPGKIYPEPLVDHGQARNAALLAFDALKRSRAK